jgi:hypothetical protein
VLPDVLVAPFKPFLHGEARLFSLSEFSAANDWITDAGERH